MKSINIIAPEQTQEAYDILIECISRDFDYTQTKATLCTIGFYLPQDQWYHIKMVIDIQMNLDIGNRNEELSEGFGEFMSLNGQEWKKVNKVNLNGSVYWRVLRGDHNILENTKGEFHENRIIDSYIGCREDAKFFSGEELLALTHDLYIPKDVVNCESGEWSYRICSVTEGGLK